MSMTPDEYVTKLMLSGRRKDAEQIALQVTELFRMVEDPTRGPDLAERESRRHFAPPSAAARSHLGVIGSEKANGWFHLKDSKGRQATGPYNRERKNLCHNSHSLCA